MRETLHPAYLAVSLVAGLLFGAGLYIAQMTDPLVVLGFLDFGAITTGGWNPSLALVIVPAIGVMMLGVRYAGTRARPLFEHKFFHPERTDIDTPLVGGAVLFGIGWGMSGICPGPAITLIGFMPENLWIFLGAMFLGSFLGHYVLEAFNRRELIASAPAE